MIPSTRASRLEAPLVPAPAKMAPAEADDIGVVAADSSRRHVFISYSHADRQWVERLKTMMAPLLRAGQPRLLLWDDSQIAPGSPWRQEIETALEQARVALLLVSDAFLASEFVMNEEVPKLLAAAKHNGVRILWVSVSPCLVEHTPLHAYQAVLPLERALEELSPPDQKRALKRIAETILAASREPQAPAALERERTARPESKPQPEFAAQPAANAELESATSRDTQPATKPAANRQPEPAATLEAPAAPPASPASPPRPTAAAGTSTPAAHPGLEWPTQPLPFITAQLRREGDQ